MTGFHQIDLMARGAAIALFLLWSWILLRDHREILAARLAVAMNAGIIGYVLATLSWNFDSSPARIVCSIFAGSTPGLFWLFARTWFNDRQQLERWAVLIVILSILNVIIMQLTYGRLVGFSFVSGVLFRIGMFGFAASGLWEAWRGREGDLVEIRRRMRPRLAAAVGITVILIAIVEIAVHSFFAPIWLLRAVGSGIAILTLLFCTAMFGMRQRDLFGGPLKPLVVTAAPLDKAMTERLLTHMTSELPHRDEEMTIAKLAAQLGVQEYRLRRHINGALGHRNFASFLNGYRLSEVKAALADVTQREVPIITIALDAGFGSLGPFNRAFREAEGMTPSDFRAQRLPISKSASPVSKNGSNTFSDTANGKGTLPRTTL
jgi:AraC-like DNA-binding protein